MHHRDRPQPGETPIRSPRGTAALAGFSLLELLLVMAVIGVVLGAGLGAFAVLDFGTERAPERVRAVLRSARSAAAAGGWPARVEVVRAENGAPELVLRTARPTGTWQFEDPALVVGTRGGTASAPRGIEPVLLGAERIDDGYLGQGVSLGGPGGTAAVRFDLSQDSFFDPSEGFALSLRLLQTDPEAAGRVLDLGGSVGLELRPGGVVRAHVTPWVTTTEGKRQAGGRIQIGTAENALPLGRWVELRLVYDRAELRLAIDGVPVAALDATSPVAPLSGPVVLGGEPAAAAVAVDVLSWSVYEVSEPVSLGPLFEWPEEAPRELRFGPDGALDPRRHPAPVRLELMAGQGSLEVVRLGRLGGLSVEVLELDESLLEEGAE